MKKYYFIMAIFLLIVIFIPNNVNAGYRYELIGAGITEDGFSYKIVQDYILNDTYAEISKYNGDNKEISIPNTIRYYSSSNKYADYVVKRIGEYAFSTKVTIEKIILPDTIEMIGDNAFQGCTNLKQLRIPKNVKELGSNVFNGLTRVTTLNFVASEVGEQWSEGWNENCGAAIKWNYKYIDEFDCGNLSYGLYMYNSSIYAEVVSGGGNEDIIIPSTIKYTVNNKTNEYTVNSIAEMAFASRVQIPSIVIPNTIINIGDSAFAYTSNLNSIHIPESVVNLGARVFNGWYETSIINFEVDSESKNWNKQWKENCTATIAYGMKYVKSLEIVSKLEFTSKDSKKINVKVLPGNAAFQTLKFESSNEKIAVVNYDGVVIPVGNGKCQINVSTTDGSNITAVCDVVVNLLPFKDITAEKWYFEAVGYCYNNKYINGINSTTFAPNTKLTRGMLVTILYGMEGAPKVTATNKFSDVKNSKYYYNAVLWASSKGIVNGSNGKFRPDDNITRQDLAVILSAYSMYKGKYVKSNYGLSKYPDSSKISSYALASMRWAVKNKIMNGSKGNLNPKGTATRAEAATMLYSYCLNIK